MHSDLYDSPHSSAAKKMCYKPVQEQHITMMGWLHVVCVQHSLVITLISGVENLECVVVLRVPFAGEVCS